MSGVATEPGGAPPEINAEDAPSIERVAAAFPNLEILELVGRGGMGFVFKARQPHLDRFVALKLLPDKLAADPNFAERFNREGRVLARLNHPHIVSVYDFGQTNGFYYLMMEFVDGVNLRQAMRAGRFSPAEALAVVPTICEALQYAHDQGILHRDIKPENILLDTKGYVKIADFGIAKLVGEDAAANVTLTMTGSSLGTPHYMAPEQLEKPSEVDHRADIYSLGVVFYEMLTGELPIGRFEAPSHKTPVSKGVDDVVFRALEKNREKRQHSATEFKTQVQSAGTGEVPPKLGARTKSKTRSGLCWPAAIGASLVGLSLLIAIGAAVLVFGAGVGMGAVPLFVVVGFPFLLTSVAGTVLGWVGLAQIRRSEGRLYGTPLGMFAAVTYPFGFPAFLVIALPTLVAFPAGAGPSWMARFVIFVLISGLLSALIWGAVAVGRWANNRPKGNHWSTRGWAMTTAALLVPMLLLALANSNGSVRDADFRPAPQLTEVRAQERLPEGSVKLLALSSHPSDKSWWQPDGTAWTGGHFTNPGHNATAHTGQRAVEMVLQLPEQRRPDAKFEIRVANSSGWSGGANRVEQDGEPLPNGFFLAAVFPREIVTTAVAVGVADGAWETIADEDRQSQVSSSLMHGGRPVSIKFLGAIENNKGDTVLTVAHDLKDQDVRLVAVDAAGEEHRSLLERESSGHLMATFVGRPLEGIERFRLQVRSYRWAIFDNVWLLPREGDTQPIARATPGVRVTFGGVSLEREGNRDRLAVYYTTEEKSANLSWKTSGSFDGAPVDLRSGGNIKSNGDGTYTVTHTGSLLLPADLEREAALRALAETRERWQGRTLDLLPGEEHTVMTVNQSPRHQVEIKLVGRGREP